MKHETINGHRINVYDDGGKLFDRYTVAYLDQPELGGMCACLAMSERPTHPQGFGQHSSCMLGRHLGRRIKFEQLPEECQQVVRRDTI